MTHQTTSHAIFVYGTLMSGQSANGMLQGCTCAGRYMLRDHALTDLGAFPAVTVCPGEAVLGEVWFVTDEMRHALDRYESEGTLYTRCPVNVENHNGTLACEVYRYLGTPRGRRIPLVEQPWNSADSEIWYAGYGSNLLPGRMACYTTAFVLGNHENYDAYKDYPKEEWHGGQIQRIRPSVLRLMRGQVYELNGRKFFTMGGASSHDIQDGILEPDDPDFEEKFQQLEQRGALFRVNHRSWWAEELPSEAEYLEARANLARVHWNVDYIISHCCPSSIQDVLSGGMFKKDALTEFFDEVRQKCTFRYWFFGHYHSNMVIEKRYAMLYEQIIRLK